MSNEPRPLIDHGRRHSPDGSNPSYTGVEHQVGGTYTFTWQGSPITQPEYEQFINGNNAAPTAAIPNPSPLTVRLLVGPPNIVDKDGATILQYNDDKTLEIIGDVTDITPGDIVFVLRPHYRFQKDRPCKGHDDAGNYVPCRLLSTGEFIWGVP